MLTYILKLSSKCQNLRLLVQSQMGKRHQEPDFEKKALRFKYLMIFCFLLTFTMSNFVPLFEYTRLQEHTHRNANTMHKHTAVSCHPPATISKIHSSRDCHYVTGKAWCLYPKMGVEQATPKKYDRQTTHVTGETARAHPDPVYSSQELPFGLTKEAWDKQHAFPRGHNTIWAKSSMGTINFSTSENSPSQWLESQKITENSEDLAWVNFVFGGLAKVCVFLEKLCMGRDRV